MVRRQPEESGSVGSSGEGASREGSKKKAGKVILSKKWCKKAKKVDFYTIVLDAFKKGEDKKNAFLSKTGH